MKLLVNRTDIAEFRDISDTVYDKVLNMHILDAQFNDVQKLLGADFFNDLIRNYTSTAYQALLNAGTYTFSGTTYTMVGLKTVIVFYSYARYVRFGSNKDTPFGLVIKTSESTEQASASDKKAIYTENKSLAFNYWENVRNFLDRNFADYPLYENSCLPQHTTLKIRTIR